MKSWTLFCEAVVGLCFVFLLMQSAHAVELYKYKDKNGKWVFTDKKPSSQKEASKLEYKGNKAEAPRPRAYAREFKDTKTQASEYGIELVNPFFAPVEFELQSTRYESGKKRVLIDADSSLVIERGSGEPLNFRYRWRVGDPAAQADGFRYHFPVSSKQSHLISQSFNGRFSHSQRPNKYAVDIAMSVGTYIAAARGGTVIWVKDDYHMGGSNNYFLDKANFVYVLHEDGTYAVYAHILQGSALVKPGDSVEVGQRLARSGSSGYSTGPHLHFVIRKNSHREGRSIPFKFLDSTGKHYTPRAGMKVAGND